MSILSITELLLDLPASANARMLIRGVAARWSPEAGRDLVPGPRHLMVYYS